jgi:hypothetical protein
VKGSWIQQGIDALTYRQSAILMLTLHFLSATHLPRHFLATPQFLKFRFPIQSAIPVPRPYRAGHCSNVLHVVTFIIRLSNHP